MMYCLKVISILNGRNIQEQKLLKWDTEFGITLFGMNRLKEFESQFTTLVKVLNLYLYGFGIVVITSDSDNSDNLTFSFIKVWAKWLCFEMS